MSAQDGTLQYLPFEIREIIALWCPQSDAFHLALTCWALYYSTVDRLYRRVVFDSQYRKFNREITLQGYGTFVRTVGGLRAFMRAFKKQNPVKVRQIECYNSLEVPDLEVKQAFDHIFSTCTNLDCIVWHSSPELTVPSLLKIKSTLLTTLVVDMALRQEYQLATLKLPNLKHLVLRPFVSGDTLALLSAVVSSCCASLETLYLGRAMSDTHKVGSGYAFGALHCTSTISISCQALFFRFEKFQKLISLKKLAVEGLVVESEPELELLAQHVPLEQLTHVAIASSRLDEFYQRANRVEHFAMEELSLHKFDPSYLSHAIKSISVASLTDNLLVMIYNIRYQLENLRVTALTSERFLTQQACKTISSCTQLVHLQAPIPLVYLTRLNRLRLFTYCAQETRLPPYLGEFPVAQHHQLAMMATASRVAETQPAVEYVNIESWIYDVRYKHKKAPVLREGMDQWYEAQISPFAIEREHGLVV